MCFYAFIAHFILLPLDHLVARWDTLSQEPLKSKRPVLRVNSADQAPNATHGSTFALKHCNFRVWSSSIDCIAGIEYRLTMTNYPLPYMAMYGKASKNKELLFCATMNCKAVSMRCNCPWQSHWRWLPSVEWCSRTCCHRPGLG